MATGTLERATEVVAAKAEAPVEATVEGQAAKDVREQVEGSGFTSEARAWNSRAQVD